jgi:hypothetical protein
MTSNPRTLNPAADRSLSPLASLYLKVLGAPGNEALLQELRNQARDMRTWLDEDSSAAAVMDGVGFVPPAWLARVYQALAEAPEAATCDVAWEKMRKDYTRDEYFIGEAFTMLFTGLSSRLTDLDALFGHLPAAPDHVRFTLENYPDVKGAGKYGPPLARCGLTPVRVWCVTSAVVPLVERLQRHHRLPAGSIRVALQPLQGAALRGTDPAPVLPDSLLRREIVQMGRCDVPAAETLWSWLLNVAEFRPRLFAGGIVEPRTRDTVTLEVNAPGAVQTPSECWGLPAEDWIEDLPEEQVYGPGQAVAYSSEAQPCTGRGTRG